MSKAKLMPVPGRMQRRSKVPKVTPGKDYEKVILFEATCRKCKTKYPCRGFLPCPNCGSIHRVDYLKDIGDATFGMESR